MRRLFGTVPAVAWLVLFSAPSLSAQGVTAAAVRGAVIDEAGQPVQDAIVTLRNTSTGARFESKSRAGGIYNFENVPVGGPYTLDARAIGYTPVSRTDFNLNLGQALKLDLKMGRAAVTLATINVT